MSYVDWQSARRALEPFRLAEITGTDLSKYLVEMQSIKTCRKKRFLFDAIAKGQSPLPFAPLHQER